MLFILKFTNNPERVHLVPELYPSHVEWLKERADKVLIPGSIRTDPNAPPVGGVWIVNAESKAEVEEMFKTDPFWVNNLRLGYELYYWGKAFPDKTVPI